MESNQKTDANAADRPRATEQASEESRAPRYHVYIRLPFNRGDFVDPGPVSFRTVSAKRKRGQPSTDFHARPR